MLKNEFGPEHPWFEGINVLVDLGYQGIQKDYAGERIEIPHKKPRKSNKIRRPKNSYPRRKRTGYYGIFSLRERPPLSRTSQQAAGY